MADNKFKRWYEANKQSISEKRKVKYNSDEEFREYRKNISKRYYWLKKRRARTLDKVAVDPRTMIPDEVAEVIISNEDDIRCGLIAHVPMFYPANLGRYVKRSVQTLRLWSLRGMIPESTYRNVNNYRLYTKDQVLVYASNAHLLALTSENFSEHPFFVITRKQLDELEPDGIKIMSKDEWRFSGERCIWCRGENGLEHLTEDGWENVYCFDCRNPYDIDVRVTSHKKKVSGECSFCDRHVSNYLYVVDGKASLVCDVCGRRIPEITIS